MIKGGILAKVPDLRGVIRQLENKKVANCSSKGGIFSQSVRLAESVVRQLEN